MGILGLTTFMDRVILHEILEPIDLKNCTILIDGYSLLYQIHSLNSLQAVHGGNYDELAESLSEIFLSFKKCNINAIFLLDGGREKSDRKIKTQIKRASQRINKAFSVSNFSTNNSKIDLTSLINSKFYVFSNLLPVLSFKIYLDLLKKFEIKHFQCTFEADYDLVCLANELQCPLLSLDSDFYVYDLAHGYIPFDYFYFSSVIHNEASNDYHIPAYIFKIENFVQFINRKHMDKNLHFKKEMMPIFAVICGNDYVDNSVFSSLKSSFDSSNNNVRNKRIGKTPQGYIKTKNNFYFKIIKWLSQFDNKTDCVNVMLKLIKNDQHDLIRKVIDESVQDYLCKKPSMVKYYKSKICQDIESKMENLNLEESLLNLEITSFNGGFIESEFIKKFINFDTTRYCLDVLMHRKTMFSCQIEMPDWPSCYISSTNIRKFYYTFLYKLYEPKSLTQEMVTINEYLRDKYTLSMFDVKLCEENDLFLSIEPSGVDESFLYKHLFKLNDQIISNFVAESFVEKKLCKKIKFFFIKLYFWLYTERIDQEYKITHNCKNSNFIRSFIVSLFKSAIIDPIYHMIKNKISDPCEEELINFENKNQNLINQFFSENNGEIFEKIRKFLISHEKNFSYLKDIRNKLSHYSLLTNQNLVHKNRSKNQRHMDVKLVHCLSEFQAIYLSNFYASTIFKELEAINLNYFFNGTFLHNFKIELDNKSNPDIFIQELFGTQSFFTCLYSEMWSYFINIFYLKETFIQSSCQKEENVNKQKIKISNKNKF